MSDLSTGQIDALLNLLREQATVTPDNGGALSMEELAEHFGCHVHTMRARLKPKLRSGEVECIMVPRVRAGGAVCRYPAYRFKKAS